MLVNVAKNNIGQQISRLQFSHHILKGERHDSPRFTYYIHIITHTLSNFVSILNIIKYVKMTITDHLAMLLLQNCLPLSLFCIALYLSPRLHRFIPLLSCPLLSLLHLRVSLVKAASMKVIDLNLQPIVSLCKWACAGVHFGNSYVWAYVQVL